MFIMNRQEKEQHIMTWSSSGLKLSDYCKANGIPDSTFRGWVKRYSNKSVSVRKRSVSEPVSWTEIQVSPDIPVAKPKSLFEIKFRIWKAIFQVRLSI
jgi:transposase-like protein